MESLMGFNKFRRSTDLDLVNDEKISLMDEDLGLNRTRHDLCEIKTFGNLLWEASLSPYFVIFWTYFIVMLSILNYHIVYKWHLQSMYQLQFHLQRIRKYIGCVIGIFSFSICWKVVLAIETCYSSIYLVLFSCLLGVMAYFINHGVKITSSALPSFIICLIGTLLVLFSVKNHFDAEEGQYYFAQSLYGIFLLVLGMKLFYTRHSGVHRIEGRSRQCNGFHHEMVEVVVRD